MLLISKSFSSGFIDCLGYMIGWEIIGLVLFVLR